MHRWKQIAVSTQWITISFPPPRRLFGLYISVLLCHWSLFRGPLLFQNHQPRASVVMETPTFLDTFIILDAVSPRVCVFAQSNHGPIVSISLWPTSSTPCDAFITFDLFVEFSWISNSTLTNLQLTPPTRPIIINWLASTLQRATSAALATPSHSVTGCNWIPRRLWAPCGSGGHFHLPPTRRKRQQQ